MKGSRAKTGHLIAHTANQTLSANLLVMGCRANNERRGLKGLKRALLGSVSTKVTAKCACPVIFVKKPRVEAGAFLAVQNRQVFIHVDGTSHAQYSCLWAAKNLLSAEDEVHLLCCRKKETAAWLRSNLAHEGVASAADACEILLIKAGFNVTKVYVTNLISTLSASSTSAVKTHAQSRTARSPQARRLPSQESTCSPRLPLFSPPSLARCSPDDIIREASRRNCDLLVVSRENGTTSQDTYAHMYTSTHAHMQTCTKTYVCICIRRMCTHMTPATSEMFQPCC